jgi:phosphate transport system protein
MAHGRWQPKRHEWGERMTDQDNGGESESAAEFPTARGHAQRVQEGLWREVLSLAAYVEAALESAIAVVCQGRVDLVDEVRADEREIDRWEVRIETECLRVLALYGLVASDLRRVIAAMRVNRELEEMADIAENLAKRATKLAADPIAAPFFPKLNALADASMVIVDRGLKALRTTDADLARRIVLAESFAARLRAELLAELKQSVRDRPERLDTWFRLINSARNLERAADHATNIAGAVVYMKEGIILRRGNDETDGDT